MVKERKAEQGCQEVLAARGLAMDATRRSSMGNRIDVLAILSVSLVALAVPSIGHAQDFGIPVA